MPMILEEEFRVGTRARVCVILWVEAALRWKKGSRAHAPTSSEGCVAHARRCVDGAGKLELKLKLNAGGQARPCEVHLGRGGGVAGKATAMLRVWGRQAYDGHRLGREKLDFMRWSDVHFTRKAVLRAAALRDAPPPWSRWSLFVGRVRSASKGRGKEWKGSCWLGSTVARRGLEVGPRAQPRCGVKGAEKKGRA
ncbi:hypothetical protein L1887_55849 [Cichorium endivia]|nr:hypothetical protein L1887_55849 [Cichorium endivia]